MREIDLSFKKQTNGFSSSDRVRIASDHVVAEQKYVLCCLKTAESKSVFFKGKKRRACLPFPNEKGSDK